MLLMGGFRRVGRKPVVRQVARPPSIAVTSSQGALASASVSVGRNAVVRRVARPPSGAVTLFQRALASASADAPVGFRPNVFNHEDRVLLAVSAVQFLQTPERALAHVEKNAAVIKLLTEEVATGGLHSVTVFLTGDLYKEAYNTKADLDGMLKEGLAAVLVGSGDVEYLPWGTLIKNNKEAYTRMLEDIKEDYSNDPVFAEAINFTVKNHTDNGTEEQAQQFLMMELATARLIKATQSFTQQVYCGPIPPIMADQPVLLWVEAFSKPVRVANESKKECGDEGARILVQAVDACVNKTGGAQLSNEVKHAVVRDLVRIMNGDGVKYTGSGGAVNKTGSFISVLLRELLVQLGVNNNYDPVVKKVIMAQVASLAKIDRRAQSEESPCTVDYKR